MAKKIFVTATNTGVGKTFTTLRLMEKAAEAGFRVGALKPIETGVEGGKPQDGMKLLEMMKRVNPSASGITLEEIVPLQYTLPAAPYVAKGDSAVEWSKIGRSLELIEPLCDILFIEGAGGLLVPIDEKRFMIDLPSLFDAHTLLVSPSRLGSINDTLLSIEALKRRGVGFDLAVNLFEERESFYTVTLPYYEKAGVSLYLLPRDLEALTVSLSTPG
ncbi:dethiobiotin synthetase [Hydrogenimonas sp.]|nr:dethiobiotin synthetase [Hydrogenimonas sp.]